MADPLPLRGAQQAAPNKPLQAAPAGATRVDERALTKHEHFIHRSGFWRGVLLGAIGGLLFAAAYVVVVVQADAIQRQWIYERGREEGARQPGVVGLTTLPLEPLRDEDPDADRGYARVRR